jgi:Ca2+-binding RTX toxin-like protein
MRRFLAALGALALTWPALAAANTSHAGWPRLTGMLLINKLDQARPLDGRPGADPFDGTDYSTRCPRGKLHSHCVPAGIRVARHAGGVTCAALAAAEQRLAAKLRTAAPASGCSLKLASAALVPAAIGHNELLGGHGSDTIHAGPAGDVIWGDYKPTGQSTRQVDRLYGGVGDDFIYASHGTNYIYTGGGRDVVHAHFGRGAIHCGSATVTVYLSRAGRSGYRLSGCHHISYKTLGY